MSKLKNVSYNQATKLHRYFLDWRYKLFAGYIVIISAIGYFIITYLQKPENFTPFLYSFLCGIAIIVTIIFALLNYRITELIWRCQNVAYLCETEMNVSKGLYSNLLVKVIKDNIDENGNLDNLPKPTILDYFNPFKHTGAINFFFVLVIAAFSFLWYITTPKLIVKKYEYESLQKIRKYKEIHKIHSDRIENLKPR